MLQEQDLQSIRTVVRSEVDGALLSLRRDVGELQKDVSGLREQIQSLCYPG